MCNTPDINLGPVVVDQNAGRMAQRRQVTDCPRWRFAGVRPVDQEPTVRVGALDDIGLSDISVVYWVRLSM